MKDKIFELANDKKCILALTPDNNGSWISDFKQPTLRDFSKPPYQIYGQHFYWKDFMTTVQNYSGNFEFEIDYEMYDRGIDSGGRGEWIFMTTMWFPFSFRSLNNNQISGWLNGSNPTAGIDLIINGIENVLGRHTIKITLIDKTYTIYFDNIQVYIKTFDTINPFPTAPTDNNWRMSTFMYGYIHSAIFKNSTGNILWSASQKELYSNSELCAFPDSNPRLFTSQSFQYWYDYSNIVRTLDLSHDFRFEINYNIVGEPHENQMWCWSGSNQNLFYIYFSASLNKFRCSVYLCNDENGNYIHFELPNNVFSDNLIIEIIGNTCTITYNSGSQSKNFHSKRIYTEVGEQYTAYYDGNLNFKLIDLTEKTIKYQYPSCESERLNLVYKNNINTHNGYFERINSNVLANIDTKLDLRGSTTSKTFITRMYLASNQTTKLHSMFQQGTNISLVTPNNYSFCCGVMEYSNYAYPICCFSSQTTYIGNRGTGAPNVVNKLNQKCVYAFRYDVGEVNTVISMFIDGIKVYETTVANIGALYNNDSYPTLKLMEDNYITYIPTGDKADYFMIFDSALSDNEIKQLSTTGLYKTFYSNQSSYFWNSFTESLKKIDYLNDDLELYIKLKFDNSGRNIDSHFFTTGQENTLFNLYQHGSGNFISCRFPFCKNIDETSAYFVNGKTIDFDTTSEIKVTVVGNNVSLIYNGNARTGSFSNRQEVSFSTINSTTYFNGQIYQFYLKNLTTGEIVWNGFNEIVI